MMTVTADVRDIERRVDDWLFRLRVRDALLWSVRGLMGGLAAGLGLALIARLRPLLPVPALALFSLSLTLAGFALAVAVAYFWPRPRLAAARYFDRLFGLAERTSTALELAHMSSAHAPEWMVRDQWADAATFARSVNPAKRLPFRVDRRDILLLLILGNLLALAIFLPNPQQAILAQQQAVQAAIQEQIEQIKAIREEILNNPNLTEAQKEELTKPLDEAQQALEEGDLTQEQAVQVLTEAQEQLQAQADSEALEQADALQQAGESLSENSTTQSAGEALSNGDLQSAADALSNIDLSQLSEAERQALADKLEQTAQALQDTNPETAAQLQAAADALRGGDTATAQAALDAAAQSIRQTASEAAQAEAASAAAGDVSDAQRAVATAGDEGQGQGQGQGQGEGQGQGQGEGQGEGQGQGQGNGNGDGNGDGNGNGNGDGSGDGQGNSDGQGTGGGRGGTSSYEEIYTPYGIDGGGDDVNLDTSGDPDGDLVGEGNVGPQNDGDVTVPYVDVLPGYTDAAYEAIDSGDYPANLSDVIRQYFSSLQP